MRSLALLALLLTFHLGDFNAITRNVSTTAKQYRQIRSLSVNCYAPCDNKVETLPGGETETCVSIVCGYKICLPHGSYSYIIPENNCTINITINRVAKACQESPCLNSGTCSAGEDGAYTCACTDGWTGTICDTVKEPELKARLELKAEYRIPCTIAKKSHATILAIAQARYRQITMITSGKCNKTALVPVQSSCENNVLSITWPTDCLIPLNETDKHELIASIKDFLTKKGGAVLDMLAPDHHTPIIYPTLNKDKLAASLLFTAVCPGGLNYIADKCQ